MKDITKWIDETTVGKFDKTKESWFEDEMDQVYIQIKVNTGNGYDSVKEYVRCLVCMNVDENSEL